LTDQQQKELSMETTKLWVVLLVALIWAITAYAEDEAQPLDIEEGFQYQLVIPPQPTANPQRIEVVEVFWYGCPHCYHFEPYIERWLARKPDNVDFVRMPSVLNPRWTLLARAYYTAELLGVVDSIHQPLFDAIHRDKRRIATEEDVAAFFAEHGVDSEKFRKAFHSFAVEVKLNRARVMARRYGGDGVPTVVIQGKYRTSPGTAGSYNNAVAVMDHLIAEEARVIEGGAP
jgi:thiol:disulfide interchange protein DsbA